MTTKEMLLQYREALELATKLRHLVGWTHPLICALGIHLRLASLRVRVRFFLIGLRFA
jgi:hypothetical protein